MNLSQCSQSRAFIDDDQYSVAVLPADRRYPVPAPGYESYVNTGYPGFKTIYTAFGPTNYAMGEGVQPTNPDNEPIDEVVNNMLPPLVFVNGKPVYVPEEPTNAPTYSSSGLLNHLTRIPMSGNYQRLPKPTVDLCRDYFSNGLTLQSAEKVETSIWGEGSDFVLRRPMPSILINGRPSVTDAPTGPSAVGLLVGLGIAYYFLKG